MTKPVVAVMSKRQVRCPACGAAITVDASIRIRAVDAPKDMKTKRLEDSSYIRATVADGAYPPDTAEGDSDG